MIKYTSKGMIKQVKNEKIQQNTLFLETAESPLTWIGITRNNHRHLIGMRKYRSKGQKTTTQQ